MSLAMSGGRVYHFPHLLLYSDSFRRRDRNVNTDVLKQISSYVESLVVTLACVWRTFPKAYQDHFQC